jgi:putative membrane protein
MLWHDGWGAGNWLLMSFMMLLFWALVVGLVVRAVRGHRSPPQQDANRGRQILDERFARGEIDADEYADRCDHLAAR